MDQFHRIRQALARFELDAILLTEEANRFYATGFHSTGSDGAALITKKSAWYFTDSRYIEAAEKAVTGAKCLLTTAKEPYSARINAVIEEENIRRLGFDDAYMTVSQFRRYEKLLNAELIGASAMMAELRAGKTEEEKEHLTHAQRIAEGALRQIMNDLKEGVTEKEIAAKLTYLMLRSGAENVSFDPIVLFGPNTSMPHGVPGERTLQKGDFITMDFGCIYRGYCSDMTRTMAFGFVTDEMRTVYETVLAAQKAGIAAARAGVSGAEVDKAARDIIESAGYGAYFGHSFGHGVGVEIHESPNASPTNPNPLPAGAVISAEPGIYLPGRFGVRIEDVLFLTEDGAENITLAPKELTILEKGASI